MLKMHEIIRVPPIFAFQVFFIFLCDLGLYGEVLEDMKNGPFSQDFWKVLLQIVIYSIKYSTECSNLGIFSR